MKKNKISTTLYYIASVLFYIASIMSFASGNPDNSGVIWLCLGSTFLCLGSVYVNRTEKLQVNEWADYTEQTYKEM